MTRAARTTSRNENFIIDQDGSIIGISANPQESSVGIITNATYFNPRLTAPTRPNSKVKVGALWYNDFGLLYTYTRSGSPDFLYQGWYNGVWNYKKTAGFAYTAGNPASANQPGYPGVPGYPGYSTCLLDRYPLQGFYRGDDYTTVALQARWAYENGVDFVICQQRSNTSGVSDTPDSALTGDWTVDSDVNNWIYQLTQAGVVAGQQFKLAFWVPGTSSGIYGYTTSAAWSSGTNYPIGARTVNTVFDNRLYEALVATGPATSNAVRPDTNPAIWKVLSGAAGGANQRLVPNVSWTNLIAFYKKYKNYIATENRNGKIYPIVYVFEGDSTRVWWGNTTFRDWYQALGLLMSEAVPEWAGVCIYMRNSATPSTMDGPWSGGVIDYDAMETNKCFVLRTDYQGTDASSGAANTYQGLIDAFPTYSSAGKANAPQRRVFTVPTSLYTVKPHPSSFNYPGHSPTLFANFLTKVLNQVSVQSQGWPTILINNMSEWGESGPGLIPNQQDRFAYLESVKNVLGG